MSNAENVVDPNEVEFVIPDDSFLNRLTQPNPQIPSLIQEINSGKVNLNQTDFYGDNALIIACQDEGLKDVALALIQSNKLDLGYVDKSGDTALMIACYNGFKEVAKALIATNKSKPENVNHDLETALTYACRNGLDEVALELIATGKSAPEQVANDGLTALLLACRSNLEQVALRLIETNKSEPGKIDSNGDTALIISCRNGLSEVARELIYTLKSKPGHINNNKDTALIIACQNGLSEVALDIIGTDKSKPGHVNNNGDNALIIACQNGLEKVALKLIEKGNKNPEQDPKPEQVNKNGDTALITACLNELTEVALALIATDKSNPGHVHYEEGSALLVACDYRLEEVALALINTGKVNLYQVDKDGISVLQYAIQNNLPRVINAFPKDEININQTGFSIETQDHTVIQDYLKETPGNIVFLIDGQYYHTTKKSLKKQLIITNIKYGCRKAGNSLQFVLDENVIYDTPYLSLSSVVPLQILIKLEDADKIIDPLSGNMFVLRNTGLKLPAIVSEDFLRGSGGASSDHCQPGKETDVYGVFVAAPVCGENAKEEEDNAHIAVQGDDFIILYKNKKYNIPVDKVNNVDELKNMFLDNLVSNGIISNKEGYKVRFICQGKDLCNKDNSDEEMLNNIKQNPSVSVIHAVVTPQKGGNRTKKVKRDNRAKQTKRVKRAKQTKRVKKGKSGKLGKPGKQRKTKRR